MCVGGGGMHVHCVFQNSKSERNLPVKGIQNEMFNKKLPSMTGIFYVD